MCVDHESWLDLSQLVLLIGSNAWILDMVNAEKQQHISAIG